jgi:acetylornithine deacetylase/succinyl-diaminopimelate desuccinylase-like protein
MSTSNGESSLITYVRRERERFVSELKTLVAIPSISADPAYRDDVRRCAQALVERMREAGMQRGDVLETKGNPVAYGEWLGAPGQPTILIYGHYDVQPVDPLELWKSPPFEAQVRDGNIYGRGTVDDKGQVMMHVAAIEAHLRERGRLPINVKVVVEGEEEIGSPNFEDFLDAHRELLACDVAIISDTAVFAEDVPSLTIALRGLVRWEILVQGPKGDMHSGLFGGIIKNPIEALAQMLAQLKDAKGHVVVPGFYDGVPELSPDARRDVESLPYDEAVQARTFGVPALSGGETDRKPLERGWYRPTLEINGIWGGYQGAGTKTIIPSWARAKLTARLVGSQDPEHVRRVVRDYLNRIVPSGVRVEIEDGGDTSAVVTSREHFAVAAAARAMERGFGKKPVFIGSGGTIGPVSSFDRILHMPQVLIGVGLPDDATHAPNEKFTLSQFFGGIETLVYLYDELSESVNSRRTA